MPSRALNLLPAWRIARRAERHKRTLISAARRRSAARRFRRDPALRKRYVQRTNVLALFVKYEAVGHRLAINAPAEISQKRGDTKGFGNFHWLHRMFSLRLRDQGADRIEVRRSTNRAGETIDRVIGRGRRQSSAQSNDECSKHRAKIDNKRSHGNTSERAFDSPMSLDAKPRHPKGQ